MKLFLTATSMCLAACGGSPSAPPTTQPPVNATVVKMADAPLACGDAMVASQLTAEQAKARYGQRVDRFSGMPSTKEKPIEVCGITGARQWLMIGRCDNTTSPFRTGMDAEKSRTGSVGTGGQCGHVIDRYEILCAEKSYEAFVDMYMCGPGEKP